MLQRQLEPFPDGGVPDGGGLAAAVGVIRRHEAGLRLVGGEGQGTSIHVVFPLAAALRRRPRFERGTRGIALLVDDDPSVRTVARRMLVHLGFAVVMASDGVEALEAHERAVQPLRLILMDSVMPRMGGEEACRRLRSRGERCPIILSTGYHVETAPEGFDAILLKPFSLVRLGGLVDAFVGVEHVA